MPTFALRPGLPSDTAHTLMQGEDHVTHATAAWAAHVSQGALVPFLALSLSPRGAYIALLVCYSLAVVWNSVRVAGIFVSKYTLSWKLSLFSHIRPKSGQLSTPSSALCGPLRPSQAASLMSRSVGEILS
jgi:hypothetical protein